MRPVRSAAVFCGARLGNKPEYRDAADALGRGLARAGIKLIYGGGRVGLMGAVADGALAEGGAVVGVIPTFLADREVAHPAVAEMIVTENMHSRKQRMFELADAFIMMPGGLGTFDEIIEIITWKQLGLHSKPVLLCNVMGTAMPLLDAISAAVEMGFADAEARAIFEVADDIPALLRRLTLSDAADAGMPARL